MLSAYPLPEDPDNPLNEEEELILKPYKYKEHDNFEKKGRLALHMYSHDRDSNSILTRIDNFRAYCCIECPQVKLRKIPSPDGDYKKDTYAPENYVTWDFELARKVYMTLCEKTNGSINWKTKEPKEVPFDYYFDSFTDIYYYTGRKKPYLYIFFNNLQGRYDMMDTIKKPIWIKGEGFMQFEMHENKITTFRRLLSRQGVKYTQWISVKGREVPKDVNNKNRISRTYIKEYIIDYTTMVMIDPEISSKWFIYPKILSWDGEMYSQNHKQMPNEKRPFDALYMISAIFQFMEHPETMRKVCLVFGECDDIPGVEVIRFKTELDLLLAFLQLFHYFDPDIILTYNGSTFDYKYLIGRLEKNDIIIENIPLTGRLLRGVASVTEMNWSSSGAGKNSVFLLDHEGRDDIDILPNLRRLYKLRQYTLQYASMTYLGEGKNDVKAKDMFRIYEDSRSENKGVLVKDRDEKGKERERILTMTDIAAYCVQDSILPIKLFDNRKIWYHLSSLSSAAGVSMVELFTRGEQIRCYSNIADVCYHRKMVVSNPQYFDYYFKGGFVGKPKPGVYKYVFTLDFASLYPSIMRAYNISIDSIIKIEDWVKFDPNDVQIEYFEQEEPYDFISTSYRKDLEDKYKIILQGQKLVEEYRQFMQTNKGRFESASEYENLIKRHEVKFTEDDYKTMTEMGLKDAKRFAMNIEEPEEKIEYEPDYFETAEDFAKGGIYGGKLGCLRRYEIRIIKKELYEGIMSHLETGWFSKRKDIKKLMKKCEEKLKEKYDQVVDSERTVHNASQNAVKLMMNSGYGFNGVAKGMLPALPVAILVTAIGRRLIGIVNELLVEKFAHYNAKVVYNDTDSSMIALDINDEDVLSGKVNLEEIMQEMEDTTNGRPEIIIYNDDSTIQEVINESIKYDGKKLNKEKKEFYKSGMIKEIITETVIENCETSGCDEPVVQKELIISRVIYNEDATIKLIKPEIKPVFRKELQMECENCCQMCPLKPKYYIKLHREVNLEKIKKNGPFKKDHKGNFEITTKGILTSKKGNSHYANTVYDTLVNQVIFMKPTVDMLRSLTRNVYNFLDDKFEPKDLCRVTELGSDYKPDNYFMNVFANYLTSKGMPVKAGDRLEYLIVRTKYEIETRTTQLVGQKCREFSMWEADPEREPIDYGYYIEKGIQEQFDFLFQVGNINIINDTKLSDVGYKPQFSYKRNGELEIGNSRRKFIHFSTPVLMISSLYEDYVRLTDAEFAYVYTSLGHIYDPKYPRNIYIARIVSSFMDRVIRYIEQFYPSFSI